MERKPLYRTGTILLCAAAILCFLSVAHGAEKILFTTDSLYHRIVVAESGSIRTLRFGMGSLALNQSRIDTDNLHRHLLPYTAMTFSGLIFQDMPRTILIIGLGGGVIPREMHRYFPDALIDVVEIDPEVANVARNFFYFKTDEKMRTHIRDGRVFVKRQVLRKPERLYDYIILDAFNSEYIPFHLTTKEFLEELAEILDPKGVIVANVFHNNRLFDAEFQTFQEVFNACAVFKNEHVNNAMIVVGGTVGVSSHEDDMLKKTRELQEKHAFSFDLVDTVQQFKSGYLPKEGAMVLTDDRAPVNVLRHQAR